MIRMSPPNWLAVEDDLAARIVAGIDAGHYRTAPKGPMRLTDTGLSYGRFSEWSEEEFDLAEATGMLRWHPVPGLADPFATSRRPGTTISMRDRNALPDVIVNGLDKWVRPEEIPLGLTMKDKVLAMERISLPMARNMLAAPACDVRDSARVQSALMAIASTSLNEREGEGAVRARASSPWSKASFEVDLDDELMKDMATPPDDDLVALLPECVSIHLRTDGTVVIDDVEIWMDPHERPGSVEILRIIDDLRRNPIVARRMRP